VLYQPKGCRCDSAYRRIPAFPSAGTSVQTPVGGAITGWEDDQLQLNGLTTNLLREIELEHQLDPAKKTNAAETEDAEAVVFISCGQFTEAEKSLGKALAAAVEELTPYQNKPSAGIK
jgi:hypothetical protein